MAIKIQMEVRGFEEMVARAKSLGDDFAIALPDLAYRARDNMRDSIKRQKSREGSRGALENAIDVEVIVSPDRIDVGVGNIQRLNQEAPYWAIQNYGGLVAEGARVVPGIFGPGDRPDPQFKGPRRGTQKFTYLPQVGPGFNSRGDDSVPFMHVTTPITPMSYIQYAVIRMVNDLRSLITQMTGVFNKNSVRFFSSRFLNKTTTP